MRVVAVFWGGLRERLAGHAPESDAEPGGPGNAVRIFPASGDVGGALWGDLSSLTSIFAVLHEVRHGASVATPISD
jgi:hypothetical protein